MDVMLDLETLASSNDAVVISIGAVKIDPVTKELGERFYAVLPIIEQQRRGRFVDASTVLWWAKQSEEARKVLLADTTHKQVTDALSDFSKYMEGATGLWGNGADFDNAVLRSLYESYDKYPPWSYKQNRCYRTMRNLFPVALERTGTWHNALDDAVYQAQCLVKMEGYNPCATQS